MKLIVGLGNPGKKYENTRHNMGFMVIDAFSDLAKIDVDKEVFHGLLGRGKVFDEDVFLFKPTTFMNLSGTAVKEVADYFKIPIDDILIVYDDMALSPGQIRLRLKGSSGSHKGMQNIIDNFKSENFKRIRIGIGEPTYDSKDFVLSKPSKDEMPLILFAVERASEAIKEMLKKNSFEKIMSQFNS